MLRRQAQLLLEMANSMQGSHNRQVKHLQYHLTTIDHPGLRRALSKPRRISLPSQNTTIREVRNPSYRSVNTFRCFQCGSEDHFKWACEQYTCPFCRNNAPGHAQRDCPENPRNAPRYEIDLTGDFDDLIDDHNLTGKN